MRSVLLFLSAFLLLSCGSSKKFQLTGYVEGEFVYIAPATSGILEKSSSPRGKEFAWDRAFSSLT
jgi:hypothetical protein